MENPRTGSQTSQGDFSFHGELVEPLKNSANLIESIHPGVVTGEKQIDNIINNEFRRSSMVERVPVDVPLFAKFLI